MVKRICGLALLFFGMALLMGLMVVKTDAAVPEAPEPYLPQRIFAMRPQRQSPDVRVPDTATRDHPMLALREESAAKETAVKGAAASAALRSDSNGRTLGCLCYYRAAYVAFRLKESAG